MPATPQDRLYGLTTSVAVKPPVFISADYNITCFGEQTITSKTPTDERTITTTEGMRILLLGQDNPVENGIWVARRSFWVRATDFNGPRDAVNGTLVFSITGDCWQVEAVDPVVIGLSAIHFRPTYPFEANLDIFQRTLRVPEASVSVLPSAEDRAWKGLGFDGAGQPKLQDPAGTGLWGYVPAIGSFEKGSILAQRFEVLLWESTNEYWRWDGALPKVVLPFSTPATAGGTGKGKWLDVTDATLRANLGSGEGLKYIGACESVDALRNTEPEYRNQQIWVLRYSENNDVRLRRYYYHQPDTTTADDGGRVIVTNGGKRWKLLLDDGFVSPDDFGAIGDAVFSTLTNTATGTDNTVPLQNMLNACARDGINIKCTEGRKYLSGSLYAYKDDELNPNWPSRVGRFRIEGCATGHATGDVENVGAAIIHKPGQTTPLLSVVGAFSVANPTGMGGYFQLERINLIGSPDTSDVLLAQGSQGFIETSKVAFKITNPAGNGISQRTVWDVIHSNILIRGGAVGLGTWTGKGLRITSDGTDGQTNMSVYLNVECYRCGYGIYLSRENQAEGTLGPIVFIGGQTSNCDQHGMVLGGGVIAFTSIGQQHEGARKNAIRIDRTLPDGSISTDIPRGIKIQGGYITGSGNIEDGSVDSFAIYIANGDGIEIDGMTFNNAGNSIAFDAGVVDNLLIRRPTWRTVRAYGVSSGVGIKAFGTQDAAKRQYLEKPTFNQNPATRIEAVAQEIFDRGNVGGRFSFATNSPTPSISFGGTAASEAAHQLNFNYSEAVTVTNILGGRRYQFLLVTFSNTLVTIQNNRSTIFLAGSAFTPTSTASTLLLYYTGSVWLEVSRSLN
ncbi:hypothetical protein [Raoultella terrigena]|uniref:tail fiber/spike domain-containing protein n=1 Tax=Raoultella terrigena TaxID=577 RepID=UPI00349FBFAD